jgi:hypothetical protein
MTEYQIVVTTAARTVHFRTEWTDEGDQAALLAVEFREHYGALGASVQLVKRTMTRDGWRYETLMETE